MKKYLFLSLFLFAFIQVGFSQAWESLTPLPSNNTQLVGAAVNDKIYLINGSSGSGEKKELNIYDINSDSWSTGAVPPVATRSGDATTDGVDAIFWSRVIQIISYTNTLFLQILGKPYQHLKLVDGMELSITTTISYI